jgi:hypothetical protein
MPLLRAKRSWLMVLIAIVLIILWFQLTPVVAVACSGGGNLWGDTHPTNQNTLSECLKEKTGPECIGTRP